MAAPMPIDPHTQGLSLPSLVGQLVDDLREVAHAEVRLFRAKAGERATSYKSAAIFLGIAAIMALEAVGALLVGLIMTIATLVGPGFATLIVVGVVMLLTGTLAVIGKSRLAPASKGTL